MYKAAAAGEMLIYLIYCSCFKWKQLYVDLMQNGPPDIIVQTLNRIIAIGIRKKDKIITNTAKNILSSLTNASPLKYKTNKFALLWGEA